MTDFELDQEFALVIIPASFGHATTSEEQLSVLRSIGKNIRPDGLFLLDLYPGALNLRRVEFKDDAVSLADGSRVSRTGIINPDPVEQLIRVSLVFDVKTPQGEEVETRRVESEVAIIFNREADLLIKMMGYAFWKNWAASKESPMALIRREESLFSSEKSSHPVHESTQLSASSTCLHI